MERIFNNILSIHHQTETTIIMMLETALSKDYDVNIDVVYRKIYIKDYDYFSKRVYIENHEFKFKIIDDYIYIEYIDNKFLLGNTLYKQCQSIKSIIEFIEDSINKIRSL